MKKITFGVYRLIFGRCIGVTACSCTRLHEAAWMDDILGSGRSLLGRLSLYSHEILAENLVYTVCTWLFSDIERQRLTSFLSLHTIPYDTLCKRRSTRRRTLKARQASKSPAQDPLGMSAQNTRWWRLVFKAWFYRRITKQRMA